MSNKTNLIFEFKDLETKQKQVQKKIENIFNSAGKIKPVGIEIDGKTKRNNGISYKQIFCEFADSQTVILKVKQTGDIFEVLLNKKILPIANQDNHRKAVGEVINAMEKGRSAFQKKLAKAKATLPPSVKSTIVSKQQVMDEKKSALLEAIQAVQSELDAVNAEIDTYQNQLEAGKNLANHIQNIMPDTQEETNTEAQLAREENNELERHREQPSGEISPNEENVATAENTENNNQNLVENNSVNTLLNNEIETLKQVFSTRKRGFLIPDAVECANRIKASNFISLIKKGEKIATLNEYNVKKLNNAELEAYEILCTECMILINQYVENEINVDNDKYLLELCKQMQDAYNSFAKNKYLIKQSLGQGNVEIESSKEIENKIKLIEKELYRNSDEAKQNFLNKFQNSQIGKDQKAFIDNFKTNSISIQNLKEVQKHLEEKELAGDNKVDSGEVFPLKNSYTDLKTKFNANNNSFDIGEMLIKAANKNPIAFYKIGFETPEEIQFVVMNIQNVDNNIYNVLSKELKRVLKGGEFNKIDKYILFKLIDRMNGKTNLAYKLLYGSDEKYGNPFPNFLQEIINETEDLSNENNVLKLTEAYHNYYNKDEAITNLINQVLNKHPDVAKKITKLLAENGISRDVESEIATKNNSQNLVENNTDERETTTQEQLNKFSRSFANKFTKINDLISSKDIEKAKSLFNKLNAEFNKLFIENKLPSGLIKDKNFGSFDLDSYANSVATSFKEHYAYTQKRFDEYYQQQKQKDYSRRTEDIAALQKIISGEDTRTNKELRPFIAELTDLYKDDEEIKNLMNQALNTLINKTKQKRDEIAKNI